MGYHRPQAHDLRKEISENLRSKISFGESKYAAKQDGTMSGKIYSGDTFKTYSKACQNFASYVIDHSDKGQGTSLDEARAYARGFIDREIEAGKSAYTITMERSALAKLYGVEGKAIHDNIPIRKVTDVTRSRERTMISEKTGKVVKNQSTRAGHFSEKNNKAIVDFCKNTGLRRSELAALRGSQLVNNDGSYSIVVKGKGGRVRNLPIIGNVSDVVLKMQAAGESKVFEKVPQKMDVHHYRREYATSYYQQIARPIEEIPRKERYYCRGDLKGTVYDKKALKEVSLALGHNRISVVAEHYLMR